MGIDVNTLDQCNWHGQPGRMCIVLRSVPHAHIDHDGCSAGMCPPTPRQHLGHVLSMTQFNGFLQETLVTRINL